MYDSCYHFNHCKLKYCNAEDSWPSGYGLIDLTRNDSYFLNLNVIRNNQTSSNVGLVFTTQSASLTLEGCSFIQNNAPNIIVAFNNKISNITLINCSFIENQCTNEYIGIYPATVDAQNVYKEKFRIFVQKIPYCDPFSKIPIYDPTDLKKYEVIPFYFAVFIVYEIL